jgi:hypothetical protein
MPEDLDALKQKILYSQEYRGVFDSEGMDEEATKLKHRNPEDASHVLEMKEAIDFAKEELLAAKSLSEIIDLISSVAGGTSGQIQYSFTRLNDVADPAVEQPMSKDFDDSKKQDLELSSENKNKRKNGPDTPETKEVSGLGIEDKDKVSPHAVFNSPDLGNHILDLFEEYKKSGDPSLLETIKNYSKHIGERFSPHVMEARLARRKLAKKIVSKNLFCKIPQRKAQDANNTGEQENTIQGYTPDLQQTRDQNRGRLTETQSYPNDTVEGVVCDLEDARDSGEISQAQFDNLIQHSNPKIKQGFQEEFDKLAEAKAQNRAAQKIPKPKEDSASEEWSKSDWRAYDRAHNLAGSKDYEKLDRHLDNVDSELRGNILDTLPSHAHNGLDKINKKRRQGQAPAMNPPAQMSYSYSTGTPPPAAGNTPSPLGAPPKPVTPAPSGRRWVLDPTTNTWVLVPINQETTS